MLSVKDFNEYKILDMNNFEKLENWNGVIPVSYTHLDVYKRQTYFRLMA